MYPSRYQIRFGKMLPPCSFSQSRDIFGRKANGNVLRALEDRFGDLYQFIFETCEIVDLPERDELRN